MLCEPLSGGGLRLHAPAKVNLYLEVLGLRADGYHEIDTILQAVSLFDELELRPRADAEIRLELEPAPGSTAELPPVEGNLVLRAAQLVRSWAEEAGSGPRGADVRLRKGIPMGAGLGGGSSDAAAALVGLAKLWKLEISRPELLDLAARLGSDVPFFLYGGAARCRGRGEKVVQLSENPPAEGLYFVLVHPEVHVSTSLIYQELDRSEAYRVGLTSRSPLDTMTPDSIWRAFRKGDLYFNRLQSVTFKHFPEVESYFREIQREPFLAALMSGSGSTVFGVCGSRREAEDMALRLEKRVSGRVVVVRSQPESQG